MSSHNHGIDLLRIFIAFYMVFNHAVGQGGIIGNLKEGTLAYSIIWFINILNNCGANIFILISGYTSITRKEKKDYWSRLIVLYLEVLFYNVLVYLIYNLTHGMEITMPELVKKFFPVTNTTYWYFSMFVGLSAIKPLLDKGIREMEEKYLRQVFFALVILYGIYPFFYGGFGLIDGFSVIWFVVLYAIGAIAKKCEIGKNLSIFTCLAFVLILGAFTWIWKMHGPTFSICGKPIDPDVFIPYASPTMFGMAFFELLAFSKMNFSSFSQKVINFAAPSVFGVYILNTHPSFWHYELKDRFVSLASRRISVLLPRILLHMIIFVTAAVLIDKGRQILFRKLRVSEKAASLIAKINRE